jgi:hypothetical protein
MKEPTVSVTKFGTVPIRSFASALAALNLQTGEDSEFAVVLTDDQLQDGLGDFNAAALTSGRPLGIATSNLLRRT